MEALASQPTGSSVIGNHSARLRDASHELEASFLQQVFAAAGLDRASEYIGGGIGEEQLASLLQHAHARAVAEAGGIGLAELIYEALLLREDGNAA